MKRVADQQAQLLSVLGGQALDLPTFEHGAAEAPVQRQFTGVDLAIDAQQAAQRRLRALPLPRAFRRRGEQPLFAIEAAVELPQVVEHDAALGQGGEGFAGLRVTQVTQYTVANALGRHGAQLLLDRHQRRTQVIGGGQLQRVQAAEPADRAVGQLGHQRGAAGLLAQVLGPGLERTALGRQHRRLAGQQCLAGQLQVFEQDAPGHTIDHQVVDHHQQALLPLGQVDQHHAQQRAILQVQATLGLVGQFRQARGIVQLMYPQQLLRVDRRELALPLALVLAEPQAQGVVLFHQQLERSTAWFQWWRWGIALSKNRAWIGSSGRLPLTCSTTSAAGFFSISLATAASWPMLAIGGQRQAFEQQHLRRHQVLWQALQQGLTQGLGLQLDTRRRYGPGHQLQARRVAVQGQCQHHGLGHAGKALQYLADLARLDPVTTDLHLVIATAQVLQHTLVQACAVTGTVQPLAVVTERIGDEALGGTARRPRARAAD
ncbi:hypothetical protein WR25_14689 [Diploscapter pachys]|uniref:Uncharacterized protein n=1 Tax=Diploscapter pachys TaxID=2018661 RepID=A0A2A2K1X9_9BILA|nr:hypothetical protein WR25_14689 [Diploscapter pachys]